MNIVYITDDNFAQHTGISLLSLLENNKDVKEISIFIGDNGIEELNINRLKNIAHRYNRDIYFALAQECLERNLDNITKKKVLDYYGTLVGCLQFMMDKLFLTLDEIFYLDSDTIVEGSIYSIQNVSLGDKLIGAVASPGTLLSTSESEYKLAKSRKVYYNTGVMLINLKKWREEKIFDRIVEDFSKNKQYAYGAQSIINNVIKDNEMLTLDLKYNYWGFQYYSIIRKKLYSLGGYFNQKQIVEAIESPVIVHFKGYQRPWYKEFTKSYYAKRYLHYKAMTGEKGWKYSEQKSYYKEIYLHRNAGRKLVKIKYYLGELYRKVYENGIRTFFMILKRYG